MKKIAIISMNGASSGGGVERVVGLHARIFREHGAVVRIFSLPIEGFLGRAIKTNKLFRMIMSVLFPVFSPLGARFWAGRSGIVLTHGLSSIGLWSDAVIAHGSWAKFSKTMLLPPTPFSKMVFTYECLAALLSRRVIAVSDAVATAWIEHYGADPSKVEVLYNSIDFEKFKPKKISLDKNKKTEMVRVLFVGRLENAKGLDYLIRLCREIEADRDCEISLCVCTSAVPLPSVRDELVGCKIFVDLDSDAMVEQYNQADLMLLPSRYEAFELSTLESLGCGTPVLLNDTGTRPSLIRLGCPGIYPLQIAEPPIIAVRRAASIFSQLTREELSQWTREAFDYSRMEARLLEVVGLR
jgi:glycosyltransferase involved in cell wall biosynthesis